MIVKIPKKIAMTGVERPCATCAALTQESSDAITTFLKESSTIAIAKTRRNRYQLDTTNEGRNRGQIGMLQSPPGGTMDENSWRKRVSHWLMSHGLFEVVKLIFIPAFVWLIILHASSGRFSLLR
jgi:hypothetical protein